VHRRPALIRADAYYSPTVVFFRLKLQHSPAASTFARRMKLLDVCLCSVVSAQLIILLPRWSSSHSPLCKASLPSLGGARGRPTSVTVSLKQSRSLVSPPGSGGSHPRVPVPIGSTCACGVGSVLWAQKQGETAPRVALFASYVRLKHVEFAILAAAFAQMCS
jgi:hypothetical protein